MKKLTDTENQYIQRARDACDDVSRILESCGVDTLGFFITYLLDKKLEYLTQNKLRRLDTILDMEKEIKEATLKKYRDCIKEQIKNKEHKKLFLEIVDKI